MMRKPDLIAVANTLPEAEKLAAEFRPLCQSVRRAHRKVKAFDASPTVIVVAGWLKALAIAGILIVAGGCAADRASTAVVVPCTTDEECVRLNPHIPHEFIFVGRDFGAVMDSLLASDHPY